MTDHPITPPPELVEQWCHDRNKWIDFKNVLSIRAAQWGANQELEACCEWIRNAPFGLSLNTSAYQLRAFRRPKPPSLKEQALTLVEQHEDGWAPSPKDWDIIRRALEQLDD